MDMAVVGAGHVGVVTAAGFAAVGHDVRTYDVDADRIGKLRALDVPFFEPGIAALLTSPRSSGSLAFDLDPSHALSRADVVFLCVGTENGHDGKVDLAPLRAAARSLARHARQGAVLVSRSTAPPGTARALTSLLVEEGRPDVAIVVNPEFLAEGTAVRDFLAPDRVVVGVGDDRSRQVMRRVYEPILARRLPEGLPSVVYERAAAGPKRVPFVVTPVSTAELSKYAANAFLAVKISFINEMAALAEEMGADITGIARVLGLDRRIGSEFLGAGIGWGGSCFPKDVTALRLMARSRGVPARLLQAATEVNLQQRGWVLRQLRRHAVRLQGSTIALLGLAFKAGTDDMRNAPSVEIATRLVGQGATVRAFDPVAPDLPRSLIDVVEVVPDPIDAARNADAVVVLTEWEEFRLIDLRELRGVMRGSVLLDGRNVFDPRAARRAGFRYAGVGRGGVSARERARVTARP